MIPQLKPDIYRCIGKHLAPTTTSARRDNEAHNDTKAYQQNLLNLMKSSKTLYEIFAPQLYTKCSVGNLSSIFTNLNNGNSMLHQIQHLHLYSGKHNDEPTYFDLIRGDMWRGLNRHGVEKPPWSGTDEIMKCALVANLLHNSLLHDKISPFPKLRSISLGGYQDHMWGSPLAEGWEERALKDPGVTTVYKVLPVTLLAIPTVEHFCQSTEFGPLALRPIIYRPSGHLSIKIFTFHLRHPGRNQGLKRNFAPIVSGAINRYYYLHDPNIIRPGADNVNVPSERTAGQAMTVSLAQCFSGTDYDVVGPDMKPLVGTSIEKDPVRNTVVELYGLCPADLGLSPTEEAQTELTRTYVTREVMQDILDSNLPEIWKGKVSLKSKADAPPCTACGRKLMDD